MPFQRIELCQKCCLFPENGSSLKENISDYVHFIVDPFTQRLCVQKSNCETTKVASLYKNGG